MNEQNTPEKSEKWEWKSGVVAETLREAFEGLPETKKETIFGIWINVRAIRRESTHAVALLREIRDDLREIRTELRPPPTEN
jgi:hypothetical protein